VPDKNVPAGVVRPLAAAVETVWRVLPLRGEPPITRFAVWVSALECTIDISRARAELGYAPVKSIDEGLAELKAA
jgi:nucleoside-diphosphate-sugar epimerase